MFICEGLLNFFGTSSEEIIERTKKEADEYYLPKIEQLSSQNDALSSQNDALSSQNDALSSQNDTLSSQNIYLKSLLTQNNIPFNLEYDK